MLRKFKIFMGVAAVYLMPLFVFAQSDFDSFLNTLSRWINTLIPIVVALALLYFLYGLVKYVTSGGDSGGREEARNVMMWGIIALFVMVSVWGLVAFLGSSLDIQSGGSVDAGDIPNIDL